MTKTLWALLLLGCNSLSLMAAPLYRATLLPPFIDQGSEVSHYVLNNVGQTAGKGQLDAYFYDGSSYTNLGPLGGYFEKRPTGINDRGEIVGRGIGEIGVTTAFLYSGGELTNIGRLLPYPYRSENTIATDINNAGQVLGTWEAYYPESQAFLFREGTVVSIPSAPGDSLTIGIALNDAGQVTGKGLLGAFLYSNGATVLLPSAVGLTPESGLDINNAGVVVGDTFENGAFRYANGQVTALGTPSGYRVLVNLGIDDAGTIMGTYINRANRTTQAVVYENGQPLDLNTLVLDNSIIWTRALDINDRGQILATGYRGSTGYTAILTPEAIAEPVPEPATMALMGAGLLCLLRQRQARCPVSQ